MALRSAWTTVSFVLVFAAAFLRLLPTRPYLPDGSLDGSWAWGVNVAVVQGLQFGRDLIFTYGPLGALGSNEYHPALWSLFLAGDLTLAVALAAGLAALQRPFFAVGLALLLPLAQANDAIFLVLPVPMLIAAAEAAGSKERGEFQSGAYRRLAAASLASAPAIGLLPLIKLSLLPSSLISLVTLYFLWRAGARRVAAVCLALSALSCLLAWVLSGQDIAALPIYGSNGLKIVSGFNQSMSVFADEMIRPALALLASVTAIAIYVLSRSRAPRSILLPAAAALSLLAFIALKAGFVRHDDGHALVGLGVPALLLALVAAKARGPAKAAGLLQAFTVLTAPFWISGRLNTPMAEWASWEQIIAGIPPLLWHAEGDDRHYAAALRAIGPLPFPAHGSADIYEDQQGRLLATPLTWAPRPVFQSYSAYTPALLRLNAAHLTGPQAPQNVFLHLEPIDDRLAALEDGLSWPLLLSLYEPAGYDPESDVAWLKRAPDKTPVATPGPLAVSRVARLGERVVLPSSSAVWAEIDVSPSLLGKITSLLAALPPLHLDLLLADGHTATFTTRAGLMKTGFLLSPLVRTTSDFLALRDASVTSAPPAVRAFTLHAGRFGNWLWPETYRMALRSLVIPPGPPLPATDAFSRVALPPFAKRRACYLDRINGQAVPAQPVAARGALSVDGWAIFDIDAGFSADRREFALTGVDGTSYAAKLAPSSREDVNEYFHRAQLGASGFRGRVDLDSLPPGIYRGAIILHRGDSAMTCETQLRLRIGR